MKFGGAQGGTATKAGGKGGYSVGTIALYSNTIIYIYVGGQGKGTKNVQKIEGGYNGGGAIIGYNQTGSSNLGLASGGGGTDMRISHDSLYSRIIVAGGGGRNRMGRNTVTHHIHMVVV